MEGGRVKRRSVERQRHSQATRLGKEQKICNRGSLLAKGTESDAGTDAAIKDRRAAHPPLSIADPGMEGCGAVREDGWGGWVGSRHGAAALERGAPRMPLCRTILGSTPPSSLLLHAILVFFLSFCFFPSVF